jgi:hypothetical protein
MKHEDSAKRDLATVGVDRIMRATRSPVRQLRRALRGPAIAHRKARALLQRRLRKAGWELVRMDFYSPLPDVEHLPDAWAAKSEMFGVDLRVDAAARFLEEELAPFISEFSPPASAPEGGFYLANSSYESVDAETLYALIRWAKPRRVFELGSGASSHVIHIARRANEADGQPFEHVVYDPNPFTVSPMGAVPVSTVRSDRAEDIDPVEFLALEAGDILFVDTTHTVKTGGDVTHIFLEIVPRLVPGVLVHVHDIFLPYDYSYDWVVNRRYAWAEQYLVHAFLAFNETFEVVLPAHALVTEFPDVVAKTIPSFHAEVRPGAFWMRRVR